VRVQAWNEKGRPFTLDEDLLAGTPAQITTT
jgi:hypothetical protein